MLGALEEAHAQLSSYAGVLQQLKKAEERKVRFRFVERAGTSLKVVQQKSEPWAGGKCGSGECFPCRGCKGGDCMRYNVT